MKTIKFVKNKECVEWVGCYGIWHDGRTETLPDNVADRLLGLYESPFVEVKGTKPESDKMMRGAPETKEVDINELKKPKSENVGIINKFKNRKKKK